MATLVYRSLSGMAPAYLTAECQLVSEEGRRQLRSADSRTCVIRWTYSNFGDRCFAAAGPRLWNSLPAGLRQTNIGYEQFKRRLKTFLSGRWDRGALWLIIILCLLNLLTYLQEAQPCAYLETSKGCVYNINILSLASRVRRPIKNSVGLGWEFYYQLKNPSLKCLGA